MVTFETMASESIEFGNKNLIEIARKKAVEGEKENTFISISRGFFNFNGEKRYKNSISVPLNEDVINFIADKLKKI